MAENESLEARNLVAPSAEIAAIEEHEEDLIDVSATGRQKSLQFHES